MDMWQERGQALDHLRPNIGMGEEGGGGGGGGGTENKKGGFKRRV